MHGKGPEPGKGKGTSPCSPPYNLGGCRVMAAQKRYPDELRERAVMRSYQPRVRHSSRCGRSAPRVVSLPWPG